MRLSIFVLYIKKKKMESMIKNRYRKQINLNSDQYNISFKYILKID